MNTVTHKLTLYNNLFRLAVKHLISKVVYFYLIRQLQKPINEQKANIHQQRTHDSTHKLQICFIPK